MDSNNSKSTNKDFNLGRIQPKNIKNPSINKFCKGKIDLTKIQCLNLNLFTKKKDETFNLNKYLEFPEKTNKKYLLFTSTNKVLLTAFLIVLRFFNCIIQMNCDSVAFNEKLNTLRILLLFIAITDLLFFKIKVKPIVEEQILIRQIVEIEILIEIISLKSSYFDVKLMTLSLIVCLFFNLLLSIRIINSMIMYILIDLCFLLTFDYQQDYFYHRFFFNLFSRNSVWTISLTFLFLISEYNFHKMVKELWALYESFKISFFTLKKVIDDFPYPFLIVSKIKLGILYYNNSAVKSFNLNKKKNRRHEIFKSKEINIQFQDIFIDDNFAVFIRKMEECSLEMKKFFHFGFPVKNDDKILDSSKSTKELQWYRIVVTYGFWKGQESIFLKFIEIDEPNNQEFILDYKKLIMKDFNNIIESLDYLCGKAPSVESTIIELHEIMKNENPYEINMNKSNHKKSLDLKPQTTVKNLGRLKDLKSKPLTEANLFKNKSQSLRNQDFTFLFFLKTNLELLMNNYLTCQEYLSLKLANKNKNLTNFELKGFLKCTILTFYNISLLKGYDIQLEFDQTTIYYRENIVANIDHYKVIISSILNFILFNSISQNKKTLKITVSFIKFEGEKGVYQFKFEIHDNNEKILDYQKLNKILSYVNISELNLKDIIYFELFDIGIFVSNQILRNVYNYEIVHQNKNNIDSIIFNLEGIRNLNDSSVNNHFNNNILSSKSVNFDHSKEKVAKDYYQKIHVDILKKYSSHFNYYSEVENKNQSEVESYVEKDYFSTDNIPTVKNDDLLFNYLDLELQKSKNSSKKNSKEKLFHLKVTPKLPKNNENNKSVQWDNSQDYQNIKLCSLPRLLIVEDNVLGRISLKKTLKKLNKIFQVDTAANGKEAFEKFKNLLIQGFLYDFIFMDIELPEMKGEEASKIIREYERKFENIHTNIVAVTVKQKNDYLEKFFDDFFEKPIVKKKFISYLKFQLGKSRPYLEINFGMKI